MKELWKSGKIPKIIHGEIVVLEEGSKNWFGSMMHKARLIEAIPGDKPQTS